MKRLSHEDLECATAISTAHSLSTNNDLLIATCTQCNMQRAVASTSCARRRGMIVCTTTQFVSRANLFIKRPPRVASRQKRPCRVAMGKFYAWIVCSSCSCCHRGDARKQHVDQMFAATQNCANQKQNHHHFFSTLALLVSGRQHFKQSARHDDNRLTQSKNCAAPWLLTSCV